MKKQKELYMFDFDVVAIECYACMCKNICPLRSKHRKMIALPNCLPRKRCTRTHKTTTTLGWEKKKSNCSRGKKEGKKAQGPEHTKDVVDVNSLVSNMYYV